MTDKFQPRKTGIGQAVCSEVCDLFADGLCMLRLSEKEKRFPRRVKDGGTCKPWEYAKVQIMERMKP